MTVEIEATAQEYRFGGGTDRVREVGRIATRALSAGSILESTGRHHFTGTTIGLYASGAGRRATDAALYEWFEYLAS